MQTRELDGPDLVIRLTWAERMALNDRVEAIQASLEANFQKYFGQSADETERPKREALGSD